MELRKLAVSPSVEVSCILDTDVAVKGVDVDCLPPDGREEGLFRCFDRLNILCTTMLARETFNASSER